MRPWTVAKAFAKGVKVCKYCKSSSFRLSARWKSDDSKMSQHKSWTLGVETKTYHASENGWKKAENGEAVKLTTQGGAESPEGAVKSFLPFLSRIISSRLERRIEPILVHLLPKSFRTFPPSYFAYARWYMIASIAGSTGMVLSTQSMLYAIGLGAGSIPLAAAVNWVLKDGLGQLGGVLYASYVNSRFDADPKRFRMVAALSLDAACFLEALTPLAPSLFLPIASVANMGKNVSWLAASATRANIHLSFARQANLADVTAKAGSQTVLASTIGTTLGVMISPLVGSTPATILPVLFGISMFHLACVYKALTKVSCNTLNVQRAEIVVTEFLSRLKSPKTYHGNNLVPSPKDVSKKEDILGDFMGSYLFNGFQTKLSKEIIIGYPLEDISEESLSNVYSDLQRFGVHVSTSKEQVAFLISESATSHQIIAGYLHAVILTTEETESNLEELEDKVNLFLNALKETGWNTENLFLETLPARIALQ